MQVKWKRRVVGIPAVGILALVCLLGCSSSRRGIPTEILARANQEAAKDRARAPAESAARRRAFDQMAETQWGMRESAAHALARIGQPAVAPLRASLQDPDLNIRIQTCQILARIGPDASDAVNDLTAIVADPNQPAELRQSATLALARIGPNSAVAIPVLINSLRE